MNADWFWIGKNIEKLTLWYLKIWIVDHLL